MNYHTLEIIAFVLASVSVLSTFIPRFPAVLCAYLGMLCMHYAGAVYIDSGILIYWAVATAIVLALDILQPRALTATRRGHAYVTGATIAGTLLGYVTVASAAGIIIGGAVGAFLGALAFMRTPAGPRFPRASSEFMQYLCAKGLPAVVTCSMAAITFATAL